MRLFRAGLAFLRSWWYWQSEAWRDGCACFREAWNPPKPLTAEEVQQAIIQHLEVHRRYMTPEAIEQAESDYYEHLALLDRTCRHCDARGNQTHAINCPGELPKP